MTTAEHGEVGTRGQALGRQMHDPAVRDVGVGEDRQVDSFALDELDDVGLGNDRDPVGIERAGQLRGITPVVDVRDLGGGEGDYAIRRIVAKHDVDVVEVTTRCAEDDSLRTPAGTSSIERYTSVFSPRERYTIENL